MRLSLAPVEQAYPEVYAVETYPLKPPPPVKAAWTPSAVMVRPTRRLMSPVVGLYLLAAVLIASGVTLLLLIFARQDTGASSPIVAPAAEPSTIAGIIRPAAENTVSVDVPVRIQDVLVEPGQTVKRGQALFVVDDRDTRKALSGARLEMENARVQVKTLEAALGPLDRRVKDLSSQLAASSEHLDVAARPAEAVPTPQQRESTERAQAAYDQAELRLERIRQLYEQGAIARQDVDDAEIELRVARDDLDVAKRAETPTPAPQVTEVEPSRARLRTELALAVERRARTKRAADLGRARIRFERAAAAVAALHERATMSRIDAPADGTVSEVRVSRGDLVMPGGILARLADLTRLVAEVQVPSADVPHLRRGGKAEVTITAGSGVREPGVIRSIEPTPGPNGTHRVVIGFEPPTGVALSGQAASVTFPGT
jgi:multidrug efflux pump subunit AcrA (membrane-fusion protein)